MTSTLLVILGIALVLFETRIVASWVYRRRSRHPRLETFRRHLADED